MDLPICIEAAQLGDAPAIVKIARKAAPLQYENAGIPMAESQLEETLLSAWSLGVVKPILMHPKKHTLVAKDHHNHIPGFCTVSFEEACPFNLAMGNDKEWASIDALYVDPTAHRRGIRSSLLEAVELVAKQRGCLKIWLTVLEGNEAALNLYEKRRYVVVESTDFPPEFGIPNDYIMVKYSEAE
ncbi:acyl-CoA N-acyltransferase [Hypoxylon sp. FL1857]|nr:acyl-CoA N-acyltransferase [Hypoxylon sp. FL1857]